MYHNNEEDSYEEEAGALSNQLVANQHLSSKMFAQVQEALIDFDVIATPVELAERPSRRVWKLQPHLAKSLKQNMAMSSRSRATGEQLAGNLDRCVPLHFEIVQQKNTFPYFMGIKIPGMMDQNLHRDGQCVWRVPPNTDTMMVGVAAFEPENKVTQHMYNNYRMCTVEDLASDIRYYHPEDYDAYATIAVGSLAHETLIDNLDAGAWADEGLDQSQIDLIYEPRHLRTVQVTERMGKDIEALLRPEVERVAKSFISAQNLTVDMCRADGLEQFDAPKNIAGQLTGNTVAGKDTTTKISSDLMQRKAVFHVKAKFRYLLF